MGRFSKTVDAHEIIKECTEGLDRPFLFAVIDSRGGLAVTENLEDFADPADLWMQVLGGCLSIGVDFITSTQGKAAARAFVARSLNVLEGMLEEEGRR